MLNQARLKALKVREDHVRTVLDEARRQLGAVVKNPTQYSGLLKKLVLQGVLQVIFYYYYFIFFPLSYSIWGILIGQDKIDVFAKFFEIFQKSWHRGAVY